MKKFISKKLYFLENVIKSIFFPKIYSLKALSKNLRGKKLIVADIGSTGGLDKAWFPLRNFLSIYSFDPDVRAVNVRELGVVFPNALWSSKGKRIFYLTSFPPASSLLLPNKEVLDKFQVSDAHAIIGKKKIDVYKMDDVLRDYQASDFIKIDAEGADFEILKGAQENINKNCLGIQIEVQFLERNKNSPMFSEVDSFLRLKGFTLINLKREYWLRKNKKWGAFSQMQLIWGDALYLLSAKKFKERISKSSSIERKIQITKFVMICMVFGAHDYAYEILEASEEDTLIDKDSNGELKSFIDKNIISFPSALIVSLIRLLLSICILLLSLIFYKYYDHAKSTFRYSASRFFLIIALLISRIGTSKNILNDY